MKEHYFLVDIEIRWSEILKSANSLGVETGHVWFTHIAGFCFLLLESKIAYVLFIDDLLDHHGLIAHPNRRLVLECVH